MDIKLHKNLALDTAVVIVDILLTLAACFLSRTALALFGINHRVEITLTVVYTVAMITMLFSYEFYTKMLRNKYEIIISALISTMIADAVTLIVYGIQRIHDISMWHFIIIPFFTFVLISVWKLGFLLLMSHFEGLLKLLVIESEDEENSLARKIKYSYLKLYEAWYIQIDVNSEEAIEEAIATQLPKYDSIFLSPVLPVKVRDMFISTAVSMDKGIFILPDLYNICFMKSDMVQFDDTPALMVSRFGLTKMQSTIKRAFDIILALAGIALSSPIMAICALMIRLDSPGPVIYKQERLTLHRKPFNIFKFRTMRNDAEKETGAVLATDHDPRITKVGRALRSLRLDELPQLFNILGGSMSIVGPRPERQFFVDEFLEEINNYDKRFFAKAGLTGLAQVYSRYNTDVKDKTLYDLLYIKDYSFWLDIKLILLTVKTMFVKESSQGVVEAPDYAHKNNSSTV